MAGASDDSWEVADDKMRSVMDALALEPLAVVEGYVRLGEVEDAVEHPDLLWSISIDPVAQICEDDEPGIPVTVTFMESHGT